MNIFNYYDHTQKYPLVCRVEAIGILVADQLVKREGFNPLALSCCPGIRITLVDTALNKPLRFKALPSNKPKLVKRTVNGVEIKKLVNMAPAHVHYPADGDFETIYPCNDVYSTPWCKSKVDALEALAESNKLSSLKHDVILYEYAGSKPTRQREVIHSFKAQLAFHVEEAKSWRRVPEEELPDGGLVAPESIAYFREFVDKLRV